jgi:methyltransferase family protein
VAEVTSSFVLGPIRRLLRPPTAPPDRPARFDCVGIDWNATAIDAGLIALERRQHEYALFPKAVEGAAYGYDNPYFSLVDAAVTHTFVRERRFSVIVEVGSGFSSRVLRGGLDQNGSGSLVSIDPVPRSSVLGIAHEHMSVPVQSLPLSYFKALPEDALLFIDSSHKATYGSDVVFLLLSVLPILRPGVMVHVHDIFLPEEYPSAWHDWAYSEQYVLHGLLAFSSVFSVVWPGHYVALTRPRVLARFFPEELIGLHCSFWIQRLPGGSAAT